ncbi:hypothetical protein EW026_g323 [Hermanssonia centrifuga]|uniref:protein-ribulosamine 3-kinase n=1 Tax=Hermanssonia centrifuga TaxID=98765 RepID=A0A4S4KUZ3_9APHY|nr:hypothetical protein EW026_g323 [Hermanssonia centrifuga]
MQIHPAILRAIQKHEPGAALTSHTSQPNVSSSTGKSYFTKVGSANEQEQFIAEAESLKAIHLAAPGLAPKVIECSIIDEEMAEHDTDIGEPIFVSEYKNISSLTDASAKALAKRIATELHEYKSTKGFGFHVPTYCGRTKQDNGWYESWEECYDALIAGLLSKLEAEGSYGELCSKGEQYSPAQSLAIARIFGGIPKSFFTIYHQYLPKSEPEEQYELRGDLYELYHYLNHTVLFGGSYSGSARAKMDKLLRAFTE